MDKCYLQLRDVFDGEAVVKNSLYEQKYVDRAIAVIKKRLEELKGLAWEKLN